MSTTPNLLEGQKYLGGYAHPGLEGTPNGNIIVIKINGKPTMAIFSSLTFSSSSVPDPYGGPSFVEAQIPVSHSFDDQGFLQITGYVTVSLPTDVYCDIESYPNLQEYNDTYRDIAYCEIEIIISDRLLTPSSFWGHVAVNIEGTVYGRAVPTWDVRSKEKYLHAQQVIVKRDSFGYVMKVSQEDKAAILADIRQRMAENAPYSSTDNNCTTNVAEIFAARGMNIVDPRWNMAGVVSITPADMAAGIHQSGYLLRINSYSKYE